MIALAIVIVGNGVFGETWDLSSSTKLPERALWSKFLPSPSAVIFSSFTAFGVSSPAAAKKSKSESSSLKDPQPKSAQFIDRARLFTMGMPKRAPPDSCLAIVIGGTVMSMRELEREMRDNL